MRWLGWLRLLRWLRWEGRLGWGGHRKRARRVRLDVFGRVGFNEVMRRGAGAIFYRCPNRPPLIR